MTQDDNESRRRKHMAVMDDKKESSVTEQAINSLKQLVECRCDEAYTGRGRHDPYSECDYADEVKIVAESIEKLGAQLKMVLDREAETQARHDNKIDALEAKLAKAVDVIKHLINIAPEGDQDEWHIALDDAAETLAKIKG